MANVDYKVLYENERRIADERLRRVTELEKDLEHVRNENKSLNERLAVEKERRKTLIQGELLKQCLEDVNLWKSFVFKDSTWTALPPEMRKYIEEKLRIRNLQGHPDLENDQD